MWFLLQNAQQNKNVKTINKYLADMVMFRYFAKTLKVKIADIEELTVDLNQATRATSGPEYFVRQFATLRTIKI